jgi:6-phosphogluconolactonase
MECRTAGARPAALVAAVVLGTASLAAAAAPPEFVYVASRSSNTISAFREDPDTGTLMAVTGSPFATGSDVVAAVVEPSNRFLYVVSNPGTVSGYAIDASGALTPIPGSPFASLSNPGATDLTSAAVEPTGRFLYLTDALYEKLRGMRIDQATGALSVIPGSPFPLGNNADAVTVEPTGRFLYAGAFNGADGNDGISAYAIDPSTGALARLAGTPVTAGGGSWPHGASIDPSGRYLYAANATSGDVSAYAIDAATGVPSAITSTPYPSGNFARAVAVTPSRRFAYVANQGDSTITAYAIDGATGALGAAPGGGSFASANPSALVVDATGQFVYVANAFSSTVSGYRIESTGALTAVPYAPFATGSGPAAIATTRHDAVFADAFESGGLGAWASTSSDSGDLAVTDDAGLQGSRLLSAVVNDTTPLFVRDDHPQGEGRYRLKFLLDPTGFDPGSASGHFRVRVLVASDDVPAPRRVVTLVLKRREGEYSIAGRVLLDSFGGRASTPFVPLAAGPHEVQLDWRRSDAPPAQSGSFELFVDGVSVATLISLDNDLHAIDSVRLGAMGLKEGAAGTLRFDAFASSRYGYLWR